ncbi:hypothetical protein [Sphaerisporangium rhizosphaerae]|uniref:Uncharacterized protein n=1 Tax=Sphaerisporangium rhizosphaerae TaxID=2269375 RepID=A0ABW2P8D8_9ACTN
MAENSIKVSCTIDEVSEGLAFDVEGGQALLDGGVQVASAGVDDAEVYVGVGYAHGGVAGAVGAGVDLDGFEGVFFGAVVVFEPGVGGGGVEEPFGVVEDEVVVGVGGDGEFGEGCRLLE